MKPLLFIPGYPGSELFDTFDDRTIFFRLGLIGEAHALERLRGPDDPDVDDGVVATKPISQLFKINVLDLLELDVGKQAQSLYQLLRNRLGYRPFTDHFRPFGWDWRKPVYSRATLQQLEGAIRNLCARNGDRKVTLIVHSTGGLVLRALLENHADHPGVAAMIERIIAIGVPWAGLLASLRPLDGQRGFPCLAPADSQSIVGYSHAAFDLCPPRPGAGGTDMTDLDGELDLFRARGAQSSPLTATSWIADRDPAGIPPRNQELIDAMTARAARSDAALGVRPRSIGFEAGPRPELVNIVGWGLPTLVRCEEVAAGSGRVKLEFNPIQGEDSLLEDNRNGDSTVPRRSAAWIGGAKTLFVPLGHYVGQQLTRPHNRLWSVPPATELLVDLLSDRARGPHVHAAVDRDEAVSVRESVRVRMAAQSAEGDPLPGATATFRELLGSEIRAPFGPDGRLTVAVPRNRMNRRVGPSLLRFQVEVDWTGAAEPITRTLIVQRS